MVDFANPTNAEVLFVMTLAGLGSLGYAAWLWASRLEVAEKARSWATVQGKVLSAEVIVREDSDGDEYEARVRYGYHVAGRELIGERIMAGGKIRSTNEKLIRGIVAPYRQGEAVMVRYDPDKPERALLEAEASVTGYKGWLAFGIFMLAASAYTAWTLTLPPRP